MGISVLKQGITLATSATSNGTAIPTNTAGTVARYLTISATAPAYVRIGTGAQTAVAGDLMVQPGDSRILNVHGCTHIAVLQVSAAGVVQASPLEE